MVLGVGLEILDVDVGQTRHEQLDLLLVEDRDHSFRNDVIKAVEEGTQLLLDGAWYSDRIHLKVIKAGVQ